MANLSIKNLPDSLHRRLKKAAESEGRSLNAHIIFLLKQAELARDCGNRRQLARRSMEELERQVAKQPYTGNLSTEMLRQDRYKGH